MLAGGLSKVWDDPDDLVQPPLIFRSIICPPQSSPFTPIGSLCLADGAIESLGRLVRAFAIASLVKGMP